MGQQVGDQQQPAGRGELGRAPAGGELEDGVELQVLEAADPVQLLRRDDGVHGRDRGGVPGVPVVQRVAEQRAVGVEQAVVDRPAVDADPVEPAGVPARGAQPVEDAGVEPQHVPVQGSAGAHRPVREPVRLLQVEPVRADPRDHDPAAGGAQVDGRERPQGRNGHFCPRQRRKAAATPESTGTCRPVVRVRSPPVSAKTASATWSGRTSRLSRVRWA